jgi:hypothetical protein
VALLLPQCPAELVALLACLKCKGARLIKVGASKSCF